MVAHARKKKEVVAEVGPLARRLAAFALSLERVQLPADVLAKADGCLADFLACALEAHDLPWGRQTIAYARLGPKGPAHVVGTDLSVAAQEAAFTNGALGHGLVREDMHVASCTHLGVVVWPTLLALAEMENIDGTDFLPAGIVGYEVAARLGRALFDAELASHIRPTGTVGAIGGAAAGARLLGLTEDQTVAALGLAANTACGLNEWPWAGGLEMVFHPGVAARNAVTAVLLAREGFFASPTAIDGRAGLFAAYGRRERAADVTPLADGNYEIMSVYWKPAPACNYVQTPCQAALGLVERGVRAADVESVHVGSFTSAIQYPGCDHAGPFPGVLEAKMSIQYSVAAVLVHGAIEEANYRELDNSEVARLARATTLSVDPAFEAAYPQKQGAEVSVVLKDGRTLSERRDDVRAFDRNDVRRRFEAAAAARLGEGNAKRALEIIDDLGAGKSSPAALLRLTARQ